MSAPFNDVDCASTPIIRYSIESDMNGYFFLLKMAEGDELLSLFLFSFFFFELSIDMDNVTSALILMASFFFAH